MKKGSSGVWDGGSYMLYFQGTGHGGWIQIPLQALRFDEGDRGRLSWRNWLILGLEAPSEVKASCSA